MERSRLYSCHELEAILSNFKATTLDYLILSFLKISQRQLVEKYKIRFNNIIFNNFSKIHVKLTREIFTKKISACLTEEFRNVAYFSCIYPHKIDGAVITVQYFDPKSGLESRILYHPYFWTEVSAVLHLFDITNKIVAFCGNFSYKDNAKLSNSHNIISTLRAFSRNNVLDLPYFENFIDQLFDVLCDYFPDDIINSVRKLGEIVTSLGGESQIAKNLTQKFKKIQNSHILKSEFVDYIVNNFTAIHRYLEPFQNLPNSIATLFGSVQNRFLLIFAKELYSKIGEYRLSDNNAVAYYFYLKRLREKFDDFENNHYVPKNAWAYFTNEIDHLISIKELHSEDPRIDILQNSVTKIINETHTRAAKYIEPLLRHFEDFDLFSWVILSNSEMIDFEKVHGTFHFLKTPSTCENCEVLKREVQVVNSELLKGHFVEIDSVMKKWVIILKGCMYRVPMVLDLLQYLLCLPACYTVEDVVYSEDANICCENFVRSHMRRLDVDVEKIGEFFGNDRMERAKRIVEKGQIRRLED